MAEAHTQQEQQAMNARNAAYAYVSSRMQITSGEPAKPQAASGPLNFFGMNLDSIKKAADLYSNYKPFIRMFTKMSGIKIPRELDDALTALSTGKATEEELKEMAQAASKQMEEGGEMEPPEVPPPEIGKSHMTHHLARLAYELHVNEGVGVREIAEQFTAEGNPVSYVTVARWIKAAEEELAANHAERIIRILRYSAFAGVWVVSVLLLHFLLHF